MKKKTGLLLGILLVAITIAVGVTYALWQVTLQQSSSNVITTGCFNVTLEEGDAITLNNAYPITDEEGKELTPFTFTIKNSCNEKASYVINLETISTGDKILSDEYVKASLKNNEKELFLSTLNSTNENVEKVIESSLKAYKLTTGVLNASEEKTFELRLWMDENTPTVEDAMNAGYMGKITINSSYLPLNPMSGVMVPMQVSFIKAPGEPISVTVNETYSQNQKYNGRIEKVVFQSHLNPYEDAIEVVDFSVPKDQSVMGYYVKNGKTTISDLEQVVLYIQADGKIKVNPNASFYGLVNDDYHLISELSTVRPYFNILEGIENLDTSLVTDMSSMFYGLDNVTSLDVSHFDTRNVTNMSGMFLGMGSITSLDLSNFDTRNVTNMRSMFSGMSSVTNIDISNFNTSKVTDVSDMFLNDTNLTNITYGDMFIYKENLSIYNMYNNCPANKPTHESWNGIF